MNGLAVVPVRAGLRPWTRIGAEAGYSLNRPEGDERRIADLGLSYEGGSGMH
jgi:hypothetical protein